MKLQVQYCTKLNVRELVPKKGGGREGRHKLPVRDIARSYSILHCVVPASLWDTLHRPPTTCNHLMPASKFTFSLLRIGVKFGATSQTIQATSLDADLCIYTN